MKTSLATKHEDYQKMQSEINSKVTNFQKSMSAVKKHLDCLKSNLLKKQQMKKEIESTLSETSGEGKEEQIQQ